MRSSTTPLAVAVRVAVASSTGLANRGTAITSLVAVPFLQVLLLTTIAATLGARALVLTAYAGVIMTMGATIVMGIVGQVTRDRMTDVFTEILLNRPVSPAYWVGMAIPSVVTGGVVALLASAAIYLIDAERSLPAFFSALGTLPLTALGASCVGIGIALLSLLRADPYFFANAFAAVLPLTSGVVVPLSLYPPVLREIARVLPFANGIEAFRELADGGPALVPFLLEGAVCTAWLVVAVAVAAAVSRRIRQGVSIQLMW